MRTSVTSYPEGVSEPYNEEDFAPLLRGPSIPVLETLGRALPAGVGLGEYSPFPGGYCRMLWEEEGSS